MAHQQMTIGTSTGLVRGTPGYQAYQLLKVAFIAVPIVAGLDKFFDRLVQWSQYLSPTLPSLLGIDAQTFMRVVGVIEIAAGILVAVNPRLGGYVVAAWLGGIIVNLLRVPGYYDIALRDFGLALAALALGRMASQPQVEEELFPTAVRQERQPTLERAPL